MPSTPRPSSIERNARSFRPTAPLGFFDGVTALFQGVGFIVSTPRVWAYAAVPAFLALVLSVGFGALGLYGARAAAGSLLGDAQGDSAFTWVLTALLGVVALLVAFLVAISLAQPLSGFALDRIVRAQEQALGASPTADSQGASSMLRSLRVTLAALAVGLPIIFALTVVGFLFPPATAVTLPLKLLVAAVLLAWDVLDYSLSPRGFGVRDRTAWMRHHAGGVLGFGLAATVLMMIPFVGLLVLPMAVAGGTRMAVASTSR